MLKKRIFCDNNVRNIFYTKVNQILDYLYDSESDDEELRLEKARKIEALRQFQLRNPSTERRKYGKVNPTKIWFREDNIDEFLHLIGIPYKEFFETITPVSFAHRIKATTDADEGDEENEGDENTSDEGSFVLRWPDELDEKMCKLCDGLTAKQRADVYDLCLSLLPYRIGGMSSDLNNKEKAAMIMRLRESNLTETLLLSRWLKNSAMFSNTCFLIGLPKDKTYDQSIDSWAPVRSPLIQDAFYYGDDDDSEVVVQRRTRGMRKDKKDNDDDLYPANHNVFEISTLPYISYQAGLSLHWILGLGEDTTVLAKCGETEKIMDIFCLLDVPLAPLWECPLKQSSDADFQRGDFEQFFNRKALVYDIVSRAFGAQEGKEED